jgi:hypothetical protein
MPAIREEPTGTGTQPPDPARESAGGLGSEQKADPHRGSKVPPGEVGVVTGQGAGFSFSADFSVMASETHRHVLQRHSALASVVTNADAGRNQHPWH